MREIKFRAWNGEKIIYSGFKLHWDGQLEPAYHNEGLGVDSPIMQFTGLTDRNGVDIYEGDIVKWGHIQGYIELSGARVAVVDMSTPEDGLTFHAKKPIDHRFKIGTFMYSKLTHKCMEIVGNIYQNPELLEIGND